jgi:hypothetical protein
MEIYRNLLTTYRANFLPNKLSMHFFSQYFYPVMPPCYLHWIDLIFDEPFLTLNSFLTHRRFDPLV